MQVHNTATATTNYYEAPRNAIDYHPNSVERVRADSVHTTRLLTEHYLERIWAVETERNESQAEGDQLRTERDQIRAELNQTRAERHQLYEETRQLQLLREQDAARSERQCNELHQQLIKEKRNREMEKQRFEHRMKVLAESAKKARANATGWMNGNEEMCQEVVELKRDLKGLKAVNQRLIQETSRLTEDRTRVADKYWDKYNGLKTALQRAVETVQAEGSSNGRRKVEVVIGEGYDSDLTALSESDSED